MDEGGTPPPPQTDLPTKISTHKVHINTYCSTPHPKQRQVGSFCLQQHELPCQTQGSPSRNQLEDFKLRCLSKPQFLLFHLHWVTTISWGVKRLQIGLKLEVGLKKAGIGREYHLPIEAGVSFKSPECCCEHMLHADGILEAEIQSHGGVFCWRIGRSLCNHFHKQ